MSIKHHSLVENFRRYRLRLPVSDPPGAITDSPDFSGLRREIPDPAGDGAGVGAAGRRLRQGLCPLGSPGQLIIRLKSCYGLSIDKMHIFFHNKESV